VLDPDSERDTTVVDPVGVRRYRSRVSNAEVGAEPRHSIQDGLLVLCGGLVSVGGFVAMYASVAALTGSSVPPIDPDLGLRTFENGYWAIIVGSTGFILTYAGNRVAHRRRLALVLASLITMDLLATLAAFATANWAPVVFFGALTAAVVLLRGRFRPAN